MATKDEVQKLKDRIDCRELIQSLGIEFKGGNICCLNPSHPDRNPSMSVYTDHALCFGCNCNLDAIGIVQNVQNISFKDALDYLASKYNFSFAHHQNKNRPIKASFQNKNVFTKKTIEKEIIKKDTSIKEILWEMINPLRPTEEAMRWLSKRKISVDAAWKFGCRDITPALKKIEELIENNTIELLKENNFFNEKGNLWAPLLNKFKGYDEYSGLLIPIFNVDSKIHSFRWRFFNPIKRDDFVLKVLGQPKSELMPIGLNFADALAQKDEIYICEGEPDWLSLNTLIQSKNIENKIAVGLCVLSNTWKTEWTEVISKFKSIYICLHDTEKAIKVTEKIALSLLQDDSKGLDYWGNHFFRKLFSEKKDANDFLLDGCLHTALPIITEQFNGY
jgi:DNA primase